MVSSIYSTVYWPHGPHQQCSHGLTVPNSVKTAHLLLICNYSGCQKHNRLGILRERQNSVMHWLNTAIVKQLVGEFPCYMFLWLFTIHKSVSQVIPLSFILSRNESIHDISESHLLHFKYSCSTSVITDFKQLLRVPRKNKCSTLCMQDSITTDYYGENTWFAVLRSTLKSASTEVAVVRVQFCLVIFVFHYYSNLLECFVDAVVAPQPSLLELP